MTVTKLLCRLPTLLVTGCGFFLPAYKAPKLDVPARWESGKAGDDVSIEKLPEAAWWIRYGDPELNRLIEMALRENVQLEVALGNTMKARADLKSVKYRWIPTIGVGGGGIFGQAFNPKISDSGVGIDYTGDTEELYGGTGLLVPNYELNVMMQINAVKAAELNLKMVEQAHLAARLAVICQVAGTYLSLLGARRQLALLEEAEQTLVGLRRAARVAVADGSLSEDAVHSVDQRLARVRASAPSVQTDVVKLANALRVLSGENPGDVATDRSPDSLPTDELIPSGLPSEVLHNRPDIAMAEYQLQAVNASVGMARSRFFPSISLTGLVGGASLTLERFATLSSAFWAVVGIAEIPALDMPALAEIDGAEAQYYQAHFHYVGVVQEAFADVEYSLTNQRNRQTTMRHVEDALAAAKEQHRVVLEQFELGVASHSDLLEARLVLNQAEQFQNQAKVNELISIVKVYQALGGGYLVGYEADEEKRLPSGDEEQEQEK